MYRAHVRIPRFAHAPSLQPSHLLLHTWDVSNYPWYSRDVSVNCDFRTHRQVELPHLLESESHSHIGSVAREVSADSVDIGDRVEGTGSGGLDEKELEILDIFKRLEYEDLRPSECENEGEEDIDRPADRTKNRLTEDITA
jgi:hypothetical protein